MTANRLEFYPVDVGAQHLGATSFSLHNTLPAEELARQLHDGRLGADLRGAVRRLIRVSDAAIEDICDRGPAMSGRR